MTWRACLDCGEASPESRCPDCARKHATNAARLQPRASKRARGYGPGWRATSARARKAQPWCTDCGTTEQLGLDHLVPLALGGKRTGLVLGVDAEVVCASCNTRRWNALRRQAEERSRTAETGTGGTTVEGAGGSQKGESGSRNLSSAILLGGGS